jgi:signal transduction histidine kinase
VVLGKGFVYPNAGLDRLTSERNPDDEAVRMSKPEPTTGSAGQQNEAACRYLMRKVIAAAEDERKRIVRELHDQTGQALTLLIAGLAALEG